MPRIEPSAGAASDGRQASLKSCGFGHRSRNCAVIGFAHVVTLLEIADDLDDTEHADDQRQEVDAVPELRNAEGVAGRAAVDVGADETEQQADQHHANALTTEPAPARPP